MLTDVRETISEDKTYHITESTGEVSDYEQHKDTQLVPSNARVSYVKENTHKEIVNIEKSYIKEDISGELISGLADVRATDSHERANETTSDAETDVYSDDSDDELLSDLAEHNQGTTAHAVTHVDPEVRDDEVLRETDEPKITYKQHVKENAKVTRANTDTDGYSVSKDDEIFSKIEVQRKDVLLGETRNRPVSRRFKRSADGDLKPNAVTMDIKQPLINMQSFNITEPKRRKYGSIMEVPIEMDNTGEKIYDKIAAFFSCKYLTFSFMNIHARLHPV